MDAVVAATALGLAPPPDDASDERVPQSAAWTSHRAVCAAAAFDWCGNGFGPSPASSLAHATSLECVA